MKVGDEVQLRSGGPAMETLELEGLQARCKWRWEHDRLRWWAAWFDIRTLQVLRERVYGPN